MNPNQRHRGAPITLETNLAADEQAPTPDDHLNRESTNRRLRDQLGQGIRFAKEVEKQLHESTHEELRIMESGAIRASLTTASLEVISHFTEALKLLVSSSTSTARAGYAIDRPLTFISSADPVAGVAALSGASAHDAARRTIISTTLSQKRALELGNQYDESAQRADAMMNYTSSKKSTIISSSAAQADKLHNVNQAAAAASKQSSAASQLINVSPPHGSNINSPTSISDGQMSEGSPTAKLAALDLLDVQPATTVSTTDHTAPAPHAAAATSEAPASAATTPRETQRKRKLLPKITLKLPSNNLQQGVDLPPDDGHAWRKYGQKDILGTQYPRNYYRCTHKNDLGCQAIKQVQRCDEDPSMFSITYKGHHTCRSQEFDNQAWPFGFPFSFPFIAKVGNTFTIMSSGSPTSSSLLSSSPSSSSLNQPSFPNLPPFSSCSDPSLHADNPGSSHQALFNQLNIHLDPIPNLPQVKEEPIYHHVKFSYTIDDPLPQVPTKICKDNIDTQSLPFGFEIATPQSRPPTLGTQFQPQASIRIDTLDDASTSRQHSKKSRPCVLPTTWPLIREKECSMTSLSRSVNEVDTTLSSNKPTIEVELPQNEIPTSSPFDHLDIMHLLDNMDS